MLILITIAVAFFSALGSIVFHYWSLRFVTQSTKQFTSHFLMSVTVVICLFIIHFAEIIWFSIVLFISHDKIGLAGFQQSVTLTMIDYIQIAAVSFTTLGGFFSAPIDELALLIALISLMGFTMLTWSATYYYNIFSNSDLRSE